MDWKDEILDRVQRQQKARDAEDNARQGRYTQSQEQKKKNQETEFQRLLIKHKAVFHCHIIGCCHTSLGPATKRGGGRMISYGEGSAECEPTYEYLSWDEPTGLIRCKMCSAWTCEYHLLWGFCQDCHQKYGDEISSIYLILKKKKESHYGQPLWWQDLMASIEGTSKIIV